MIATVEVGVAVARPPTPANTRRVYVQVAGESASDCHLAACQIAQVTRAAVVMPVYSRIVKAAI
jgi:hypothetical protein